MIGPLVIAAYLILFVYSAARWISSVKKTTLVFLYPDSTQINYTPIPE